jgi:hypothetical protein
MIILLRQLPRLPQWMLRLWVPVSDCSLEEGIPVCFVVGSFLEKAMLASCPAVAMPNI